MCQSQGEIRKDGVPFDDIKENYPLAITSLPNRDKLSFVVIQTVDEWGAEKLNKKTNTILKEPKFGYGK